MEVLDAFVVSLGLDPRQYNDEMKKYRDDKKRMEEEDKKQNDVSEGRQKRLAEGIRNVRNEVVGLAFVLAGANGIRDFAANILAGDAATGRLSQNLGLATEQLGAWEAAVKTVGGSSAGIDASLSRVTDLFQKAKLGIVDPQAGAALQGLGVSDISDPQETLLKIAEASSRMSRPEFYQRGKMLGFDDATINLLAQGRKAVEALLEKERELGVANAENARAAEEFQKQMALIETAIMGKARPAIEKIASAVGDWLTKGDNLNTALHVTEGILGAIAIGAVIAYWPIALLAGGIALVVANLDRLKNAWSGFSDWFGSTSIGQRLERGFDKDSLIGKIVGAAGSGIENLIHGGSGGAAGPTGGGSPSASGISGNARNNPGNIIDSPFARSQPGYTGASGRFATFANAQAGENAQRALIMSYMRRGFDTPAKIAARWAPRGDGANDPTAYAATIAKQMGIGVNDRITAGSITSFQHAQGIAENGFGGSRIRPGMTVARAGGPSSTSQTTSIGQVNVYTQATDADGIAHGMRGALAKRGLVAQANTGLNQ